MPLFMHGGSAIVVKRHDDSSAIVVKMHGGSSTIVVMRHSGDVGLIWWVSWVSMVVMA